MSREKVIRIVFFLVGLGVGFTTSIFRIFAPFAESTDNPEMKLCRHPIEISGCEGQYLLVAKFIDSSGALLRYSFIITEDEEDEAIDYAQRKSEEAFNLISIVRMNYFDETISENEKLIKTYEDKRQEKKD